ncbi:MAG: ATP-dependent endonuclease [bacterium]|nr:ATP-dependent endonuclease [bacterium]
MRIKAVHIENFRCILDETLEFDNLTMLLGANGAGKSTFLRAIDLFYSPSPTVTADDFFAGDTSTPIVISITYSNLSDKAKDRFTKYLSDDALTVDMVITWNEKPEASYHGTHLQNPDFEHIYSAAKVNKTEARSLYTKLREEEKYQELPNARKYEEVLEGLQTWEEANPDKCERRRDDGQFFGFRAVGRSYLFDYSRFLFISAVRDASQDAVEGKNSIITRLMDLVVRNALASREELTKFKAEAQRQYEELLKPEHLTELSTLREQLTNTLKTFVPNAAIDLEWQQLEQLNIPMPKANVGLVEDGYKTKVEMTGHGLQRAFIFTLLQHLALAQREQPVQQDQSAENEVQFEVPSFMIAIEEPELYQHPNRQRYFGRVLRKLANGDLSGVVDDIQLVCATHSPLFVDPLHFDEVRIIRKQQLDEGLPKTAKCYHARYDDVAKQMGEIKGDFRYTVDRLRATMPQMMSPFINEGFFADVVVIVEGESDRAILLEVSNQLTIDLESMGISIVPTIGKGNLVIPAVIFRSLNIPTYLLWDCDDANDNAALFAFVDTKQTNRNSDMIQPHFTAFHKNREHTMTTEVGHNLIKKLINKCKSELGSDDIKRPLVIKMLIELIYQDGGSLSSIEKIINHIVEMRMRLT